MHKEKTKLYVKLTYIPGTLVNKHGEPLYSKPEGAGLRRKEPWPSGIRFALAPMRVGSFQDIPAQKDL